MILYHNLAFIGPIVFFKRRAGFSVMFKISVLFRFFNKKFCFIVNFIFLFFKCKYFQYLSNIFDFADHCAFILFFFAMQNPYEYKKEKFIIEYTLFTMYNKCANKISDALLHLLQKRRFS